MSHSFALVLKRFQKAPLISARAGEQLEERWRTLNLILFLTLVAFGLGYLIHINALATRGYTLRDYQKKKVLIQKENEKLQLQMIESQSLGTVQKKIETMQLVKSDSVGYLKNKQAPVAIR